MVEGFACLPGEGYGYWSKITNGWRVRGALGGNDCLALATFTELQAPLPEFAVKLLRC